MRGTRSSKIRDPQSGERRTSRPRLQSRADRSQVPRSQHTGRFDIRAWRGSCAVLRSHTHRGERAFMPGPTAAVELLPARRWPSRVKRSDTLREILQGCGPAPGNRTEVGGVLASREKPAFRSGYHHSNNVTAAKIRGRPEFWRTTTPRSAAERKMSPAKTPRPPL